MILLRSSRALAPARAVSGRVAPAARALGSSRIAGPVLAAAPRSAAVALALATAAAVAACNPRVDGNGVLREETRDACGFTGVDVRHGIRATVTAGGACSVRVSGDENVVEEVSTQVEADPQTGLPTLHVDILASYTTFHQLQVTISTPALSLVRASGSSDEGETAVTATGVQATSLGVSVADRAHVTIEGAGQGGASRLVATASGRAQEAGVAAELDAHLYPVADAEVRLSTAARAWVSASASVTGIAPAGTAVLNTGGGQCLVQDGLGQASSCGP